MRAAIEAAFRELARAFVGSPQGRCKAAVLFFRGETSFHGRINGRICGAASRFLTVSEHVELEVDIEPAAPPLKQQHNCDAMGCASDHVVATFRLSTVSQLAPGDPALWRRSLLACADTAEFAEAGVKHPRGVASVVRAHLRALIAAFDAQEFELARLREAPRG